jgi:glycosyltransferase involved in cell wall biosynthesis
MALPISILLPTRNSMRFLPEHIRKLAPLISLVEEVVHVDSESRDGAVELIREKIPTEKLRFFAQPPGLYQSWNFGIQQVGSKYVYISTIGDSMQPNGLQRLCEVAEKLDADVVVSIPEFHREKGGRVEQKWPVHRMIDELDIHEPSLVPKLAAFSHAVAGWRGGILNSSASNLYRTEVFQARPFPLEFGTAGDVGWGVANSLFTKIAICPETFSTFLVHEKTYSLKDYRVPDFREKVVKLARKAAEEARLAKTEPVERFLAAMEQDHQLQCELEQIREGTLPWIFVPAAWRLRREREQNKNNLEVSRRELVRDGK